MLRSFALLFLFLPSLIADCQKKDDKKYPTLLWEITGNGLKKPSYLFGTMHVSSKMVFHLSDSFYLGIRNADVVALELDPQLWQDQMFRFQNLQTNLRFFTQGAPNDFLNEKSFQLEKYENKLKAALSEEPTVINGLLYRTFQPRADFEEDTYLDLYIYQTGRKLGKQATGVENYFETEKLIMEASQDMMRDKKKKPAGSEGESLFDIERKTQEAYRKGDLDLLDSLEKMMQPSDAFLEKFLYRRNEIQAASIDSIIQHHSLFVGVGAAHLPGKRGVIELLRKKGYRLRPMSMQNRDANQKEEIDKVKVPVVFTPFHSPDAGFSVQLPGKLYKREDSRFNDSWEYADMSNGAYYMITRVNTDALMLGQSPEQVYKKIDSLLYENIPGKILRKIPFVRNGCKGFEITNKTRRGDMQRYQILVSPFEVFVFKMSGPASYVEGKEGDQYFNSIQVHTENMQRYGTFYEPPKGGFRIQFPTAPFVYRNAAVYDGVTRWQYQAYDSTTGNIYQVWKKSIQNFRFLEEDTFNLSLLEESFGLSEEISKQLSRRFLFQHGMRMLDAEYRLTDNSYMHARYIVHGPHYFLLAARTNSPKADVQPFFNSFSITPYQYGQFRNYTDTFLHISVQTSVIPDIDAAVRGLIEKSAGDEFVSSNAENPGYWPRNKNALFQDDSTGEAVYVVMETFPKYYYPKDTATFWKEELNEHRLTQDFILRKKTSLPAADSLYGFEYVLADTNSSSVITTRVILSANHLYRIICLQDSSDQESEFIRKFKETFRPDKPKPGETVFAAKLDLFFHDFYSHDSAIAKKARDAASNIYFGEKGVSGLLNAINSLNIHNKDYFNLKTRLIHELGYINDSTVVKEVVNALQDIYQRAGDTTTFQQAVLKALSRQKSKEAFTLLKTLVIQDPPIYDNQSDYTYLFQNFQDSPRLARTLFPEILQLFTVDDYKENVLSLLTLLVDSGYLKAADYASWFPKLYFDAKIQWKKQQGTDEKRVQKKSEEDQEDNSTYLKSGEDDNENSLQDYAVLLVPFYHEQAGIPHFFDKLLRSADIHLRLNTAVLMLRNNLLVHDSIFLFLAEDDRYRSILYEKLSEIHHLERFPSKYKNQIDMARSLLVCENTHGQPLFAVEQLGKEFVRLKQKAGYVYYFRYRKTKDDDWEIGISGLQPENLKEVNSESELTRLTNKKYSPAEPVAEQFAKQLKRLIFSKHKSAASFYLDNDYYLGRNNDDSDD